MTTDMFKTYIGVDPTAEHQFTFAAMGTEMQLITLAAGGMDELLDFVSHQSSALLGLNAPYQPNTGIVRKIMEDKNPVPGHLRGADMRLVEWELRDHGILLSPTPARKDACPSWMQLGFELYKHLEDAGFNRYPARKGYPQFIETHPHAGFCALLGKIPLPKPTLEGRLQRQTVLFDQGMGIKDPMAFFEEITLHKILQGSLPMELVYTAGELDSLAAACVAFRVVNDPEGCIFVGDEGEGRIALPVKKLLMKYQ